MWNCKEDILKLKGNSLDKWYFLLSLVCTIHTEPIEIKNFNSSNLMLKQVNFYVKEIMLSNYVYLNAKCIDLFW